MNGLKKRYAQRNILLLFPFLLVVLLFLSAALMKPGEGESAVRINEICASNLACLADEEGNHPDWLELYNSGDRAYDLTGWMLSDSARRPDKWIFPEVTIQPGEYLVLYTSGVAGEEDKKPDIDEDFDLKQFLLTGSEKNENIESRPVISFRFSAEGFSLFLSDSTGRPVDFVEVPALHYDTSYGRREDGEGSFERLTVTPGYSNRDAGEGYYPELPEPVFSATSGFYTDEFNLTMSATAQGEIHYTLDGSEPEKSSPLYTEPVIIRDVSSEPDRYADRTDISPYFFDYYQYRNPYKIPEEPVPKCTVVRARLFDSAGRYSDTVTATYFAGSFPEELEGYGVISLVTDPENLFDPDKGIYVIGNYGAEDFERTVMEDPEAAAYASAHPELPLDGSVSINGIKMTYHTMANYNQSGVEWERPASFTVFNALHELVTAQEAGIRIKGNGSRWQPQKSFKLFARGCYSGSDIFLNTDELIPGYRHLSKLLLYSCADDEATKVKDALYAKLTENLDFTSMEYGDLYYVYLDGEFWGSYRLCSERDTSYLAERYDLDEERVGIVKERLLQSGDSDSRERYEDFRYFMLNCDLSREEDYQKFQEFMDLESLLDYYGARLYLGDAMDWPMLNSAMWSAEEPGRAGEGDGRWRWLNYDNNNDMRLDSVSVNSVERVLNGREGWGSGDELFQKLTRNRGFCEALVARMEELSENEFAPSRADRILEEIAGRTREGAIMGNRRFFKEPYASEVFDRTMEDMKRFFDERGGWIIPQSQETLLR
ncbi:MAG: CotH kinase family protein [Lachnospiraceae bacterium]|nr:CotH kinase family protein [Lachnospiraceae bacterium]